MKFADFQIKTILLLDHTIHLNSERENHLTKTNGRTAEIIPVSNDQQTNGHIRKFIVNMSEAEEKVSSGCQPVTENLTKKSIHFLKPMFPNPRSFPMGLTSVTRTAPAYF